MGPRPQAPFGMWVGGWRGCGEGGERRGGTSFVPVPFWELLKPFRAVPGPSWNVPDSFRGHSAVFLPKNHPWHLVARIQFRMEAAACWPILAVVGLSFLGSGPKQDEEVCEYSELESSCWAGDTVIHQEA